MFPDPRTVTLSQRSTQLREIIKAFHGAECSPRICLEAPCNADSIFVPGYDGTWLHPCFPPEEAGWNNISTDLKLRSRTQMILCTGSLKISSRGAHVKEFLQKDAVVKRTRTG